MRLTDSVVVQFVDPDKMVFVDDSTGREVVRNLTITGTGELLGEIRQANDESRGLDVSGVYIPEDVLVPLAYAVGYFARSAQ